MTDIRAQVGDTNTYDITLTDDDGALDLTGMVVTFTAKRSLADLDDDAVIVKTDTDGIVVSDDPTDGTLTLTLEAEDTEELTSLSDLRWDLQVENGSDVKTPLSGRLILVPQVTRGRVGLTS